MERELEYKTIFHLLIKWKFHLLIVFVATVLLSFIFSLPFFITPRFKSIALVYPSNIAPYSNESMTEQMIEMMESGFVKDSLVKTFNLFAKYNIDQNSTNKQNILDKTLKERMSVDRTDNQAISISVLDEDPVFAKQMVEKIIYFTEVLIRKLQTQKLFEIVEMNKNGLQTVKIQLDSVNLSLNNFRLKYNILDYGIQLEQITRNYYKSLATNGKGVEEMKIMLDVLKHNGTEYQILNTRFDRLSNYYANQETELLKSIKDYERSFTYTNIISTPFKSDEKAYPVRWIIVAASSISSLFLAFLLILFYEKRGNYF